MRLPIIIAGGIASLVALAMGKKKTAAASEAEPPGLPQKADGGADTTSYPRTADEWVDTAAQWTKEAAQAVQTGGQIAPPLVTTESGIPQVPSDAVVPVATSTAPKLANIPNLQTSAGWPPIVPQQGTTAGAVSVSTSGAVDDAFDTLLANAIAKGDIEQLKALAEQALSRGLTDVAESIRAEIARLTQTAPIPTPPVVTTPKVAPTIVPAPTGRATISMAAGSRGPDVIEWQRIVNVKQDGIFGPVTDSATRAWQKAHPPLVVDGIVGPKTWAAAYAVKPTLATEPRPVAVVTTSGVRPTISQALGSRGPDVVEWQRILGIKQDGIFGPITDSATRAWQKAHPPLVVDGIVGPKTWAAAYAAEPSLSVSTGPVALPAPVAAPVAAPESDIRTAAIQLTDYLKSIGGLAGRGKEDKPRIAGYLSRLEVPDPKGLYGRQGAKAVMVQGLVPVVPYYWPSTGTAAAKSEFTTLVKNYAAADPARASQWNALIADIQRA